MTQHADTPWSEGSIGGKSYWERFYLGSLCRVMPAMEGPHLVASVLPPSGPWQDHAAYRESEARQARAWCEGRVHHIASKRHPPL